MPTADADDVRRLLVRAVAHSRRLTEELTEARERVEHLEIALATNRHIAMAVGIVMARRGLTEPEAFDVLRLASHASQRKVRDLAEHVIYTGDLPAEATG